MGGEGEERTRVLAHGSQNGIRKYLVLPSRMLFSLRLEIRWCLKRRRVWLMWWLLLLWLLLGIMEPLGSLVV
jgi:hypothetical protein